jgi:hypothetical protein
MDQCTDAANALRERLVTIDPPAWEIDGFRDELHWDIGMCNFSPRYFEPPAEPGDRGNEPS